MMHQWDLSLFSVTPAAKLLSRCVSVGAACQFQLQLELLKVDEQSADIGHVFHLAQKNEKLQMLGGHLMGLLREQKSLRLRLMRPLAHTNLPVLAHMHRFVVNAIRLMMDFIESLEEKLRSAHNQSSTTDGLVLLDTSHVLLLSLAAEGETLSNKILQWRTVGSSQVTSEPHPPPPPAGLAVCGLQMD
ncbi:HAUS augmin-like complex subunit 2 isoform X2 [Leuresthes tenuis]|uniref:HAUS augmin-like complex subunit 2 isoform X2 n=1 Tax=Leuresthes tenuis TaxID=355514 RepID=UPI003B50DD1D